VLRRLSYWLVRFLGPLLISGHFLTIRFRENERSRRGRRHGEGTESIFAFWHSHQLSLLVFYRHRNSHILISRSKDGEYAAILAERFGHQPLRGSSSRGGAYGARALIRAAQDGYPIAITPDGPRGPRHSVQRGVLAIAARIGRPVVPMAIGYSDLWELNSWDRFRIPKPFAYGVTLLGEPIHVPRDLDDEGQGEIRQRIQRAMIDLEEEADRQARAWKQRARG